MISHGMLLWLKTVEKNCRRNSRPDRVHGLPAAQSGEFVVLIANLLEEDALMDARDFDFQRIAQGYKKRPFLHKQVIERFHRDVASRNFCNGLDIGCGAGLSSKALKMICRHVTGTDISGEMIAAAKELYKGEEGYDFIVSRAEELPDFPVRFEVVTAAGVVQWVEKDRFLTGLGKKMVENGYLLVYDFCISDRMKDCPAYTAWWHDCYLKEFPRPFRNEAVWTKEDAARCGFRMKNQIQYEMEYEFDQEAFTTFMMIQSNVNAKIEGGSRSVRAVREWFEQSVEPLFHGERRTVIFTGYSWYMERE